MAQELQFKIKGDFSDVQTGLKDFAGETAGVINVVQSTEWGTSGRSGSRKLSRKLLIPRRNMAYEVPLQEQFV